jgi:hypothetical protein
MYIVMGADTALNSQPAASPGRCMQASRPFKILKYESEANI